MLEENVGGILRENGFSYSEYYGCFDFVARKTETILLLKVLQNVDSFQYNQANNLKAISTSIPASAMLIGAHTRREKLSDNIVYDRFEVPTMTVRTFENILVNEIPKRYRFRGGAFVEIDPAKLKEKRLARNMTQQELADNIGVTKKSIYEHESKKMGAHALIAERIEKLLGEVTLPVDVFNPSFDIESTEPEGFEAVVSKDLSKLGFKTNIVHQTPFNIMANSENILILSDAEENSRRVEKNVPYLSGFSKVAKKPVLGITKEETSLDIPTMEEKTLRKMHKKDLVKFVKKW